MLRFEMQNAVRWSLLLNTPHIPGIQLNMNFIFFVMTTSSIALMIYKSPELVLSSMINGAGASINLALRLLAIYSVWISVMRIIEQSGLDKKIAKLLSPIVNRLFKGESDEARAAISMNFSANMLGIGSVATPLGIKAIERMDKGSLYASHNIILFVVINCTSLELLPSTILGMRASLNSINPADIILPTLISSAVSTICGVCLCLLIRKFCKDKV